MNSDLFPFEFLFMEKDQGSNWKNLKEFLLLFLLNFLSSFRFFSLLLFSFGERKWESRRIKMSAPIALKRFCKNTTCLSKTQILILGQNCEYCRFLIYLAFRFCICPYPSASSNNSTYFLLFRKALTNL